jgi:2TM domain-containing protein
MAVDPQTEPELRAQALERLKKRQDFRGHLLVYVLVNAMLWTIWALIGMSFPWPAIVMAGWGVGLVMNAWDVYWRRPITDTAIDREVRRLRGA